MVVPIKSRFGKFHPSEIVRLTLAFGGTAPQRTAPPPISPPAATPLRAPDAAKGAHSADSDVPVPYVTWHGVLPSPPPSRLLTDGFTSASAHSEALPAAACVPGRWSVRQSARVPDRHAPRTPAPSGLSPSACISRVGELAAGGT